MEITKNRTVNIDNIHGNLMYKRFNMITMSSIIVPLFITALDLFFIVLMQLGQITIDRNLAESCEYMNGLVSRERLVCKLKGATSPANLQRRS